MQKDGSTKNKEKNKLQKTYHTPISTWNDWNGKENFSGGTSKKRESIALKEIELERSVQSFIVCAFLQGCVCLIFPVMMVFFRDISTGHLLICPILTGFFKVYTYIYIYIYTYPDLVSICLYLDPYISPLLVGIHGLLYIIPKNP